jgi:mannose-1-phosphate guanylyltransferase
VQTALIQPVLLGAEPGMLCAALTLAAVRCVTADDPVLLAMPAEHMVARPEAFRRALQRGGVLAQRGFVVSFGRVAGSREHCYVQSAAAPEALALWKSGILMVRASVWIEAAACFGKELVTLCERALRSASWHIEARESYAILEGIAALGSPGGPCPEAVIVALEAGPGAVRAWDLCDCLELSERRLAARLDGEGLLLSEAPSYAPVLQAA